MFEIVGWDPRYAADFDRLNRWWLERYFTVEPLDEHYLADPQGAIVAKGGTVFFALEDGVPVGCCAAIPHESGRLELAKLGVDPAAHGRGIGRALCRRVIAHARETGWTRLMLTSNSRLATAVGLYERLGFVHRPMPFAKPYEDADIYMELDLGDPGAVGAAPR